jgi:hypothetical protein
MPGFIASMSATVHAVIRPVNLCYQLKVYSGID